MDHMSIPSNIQMPNLAQVAASMLTIRYTLRMMLRVGMKGTSGTFQTTIDHNLNGDSIKVP